jgi:GNAT superfamily N-acetyltransferase
MESEIRICRGSEVGEFLPDAARLRIAVFREFPYLYEGEAGAEQDYLSSYAGCPDSVFVVALAAGGVVGISTGLPLAAADPSFRRPFEDAGFDPGEWFYFGESVLASAWRGRGIGHRFFDGREFHAWELGFHRTCFCAVERPEDHPLKPAGYRSHDGFWSKRGYVRCPGLQARFAWRQVDSQGAEVENVLTFWTHERSAQM